MTPRRLGSRVLVAALALLALPMLSCAKKDPRTVVVFWQFSPPETIEPLLRKFELSNPGIRVEMQQLTWQGGLEKISAAVAARQVPDLCELGSTWHARFAASGALADWTEGVQPLMPHYQLWRSVFYDGKFYGMPWVMGTRAFFYNKDLFARAGLDTTQAPQSWDDVVRASRAVRALGRDIYGFGLQGGERNKLFKKFMGFAWSNGGEILSADGKHVVFNSPQNLAALKFYLSLKEFALVDRQEILDQAFKSGHVGMQVSGAWLFRTIPQDAPGLNYGTGLIPAPPGGTHAAFAGAEILTAFKDSKHPNEAFQLAMFLLAPENAAQFCQAKKDVQPSAVGSEENPYYLAHPKERVFVTQLKTAVAPPNLPQWVEMEQAIEDCVEQALLGTRTPEQALADAQARLEKLLNQPGS